MSDWLQPTRAAISVWVSPLSVNRPMRNGQFMRALSLMRYLCQRACDRKNNHTCDMTATLGEFVRARRLALKLTQVQLALKAGLSQATISDIERGRNVTSREISALADALEVEVGQLLKPQSIVTGIAQHLAAYSAAWPPKALLRRVEKLPQDQLETLTGIIEDFVGRYETKVKRRHV